MCSPGCCVWQNEVAALEQRSLVLRTRLFSTVLDLKVDAKLACFVRNALASHVIVDDVEHGWVYITQLVQRLDLGQYANVPGLEFV